MALSARLKRIEGETPKGLLRAPFYLPAMIGNIGWSESFAFTDYDTVRAGERSLPSLGRQLITVDDIETLTVAWGPKWLVHQEARPGAIRAGLFGLARSHAPFELTLKPTTPRSEPLLRVDVTIRSISPQMRSGEPDTMYFALVVKQWKTADGKRKGAGKGKPNLPTTHELDRDDTLYSLAEHYFHTALGADDIARANGVRNWGKDTPLVKHPRFRVGSKVKIPNVPIASINPPKDG